jgi:hypothetical protein
MHRFAQPVSIHFLRRSWQSDKADGAGLRRSLTPASKRKPMRGPEPLS